MERITVHRINAFVDEGRGGNPAGVVFDADGFNTATKQTIAACVGLSETAFVSSSEVAGFKLEFFTPRRQIAHCGHATIATFAYLAAQGRIPGGQTSKETIDGNRDIFIRGDAAYMEQRAPRYTELDAGVGVTVNEMLNALGIGADLLLQGQHPCVVDTGNAFLIIPLRDEEAVRGLAPDQAAMGQISEVLDLVGFYVFSTDTRVPGRDAGARMFAPRYGIAEEAATGMAAGPLACYLHDYLGLDREHFLIEQGHLMSLPSPSVLTVELQADNGYIQRLLVGGRATVLDTLVISLDDVSVSLC